MEVDLRPGTFIVTQAPGPHGTTTVFANYYRNNPDGSLTFIKRIDYLAAPSVDVQVRTFAAGHWYEVRRVDPGTL